MNSVTSHRSGPVLVVGAGPAGLAAALELAKWGITATIIDALDTPRTTSRAGGIQPRTFELLDRYDVTDVLLAGKKNGPSMYLMYQDGREVGRIDLKMARSRYAGPPAVPQAIFEGVLRDAVTATGAEILWQHELVALEQGPDGATARIRTPDGELVFKADYVLGCDGAGSTVRNLLGLEFVGTSQSRTFGLMDARLDWDYPPDALRIFRDSGPQQIVIVPFNGEFWRLQIDHRRVETDEPPTVEEMQEVLERVSGVKGTVSDPTWASSFRVHMRQVDAYSNGRAYVVGDAAHIHSPAGAQGLNTGVQDAINLGWKLGLVLQGKAGPGLLATYEAERRPIAEAVLKFSDRMGRENIADAQGPPAQLLVDGMAQLLVNYRPGPLGSQIEGPPIGPPAAGDRLPDVEVDGVSVYRGLHDAAVVVALFGDEPATSEAAAALAPFGDALTLWRHGPGDALAQALGMTTGAAVIRPDAYLGLLAPGPVQEAATHIATWLRDSLQLAPARTEKTRA